MRESSDYYGECHHPRDLSTIERERTSTRLSRFHVWQGVGGQRRVAVAVPVDGAHDAVVFGVARLVRILGGRSLRPVEMHFKFKASPRFE